MDRPLLNTLRMTTAVRTRVLRPALIALALAATACGGGDTVSDPLDDENAGFGDGKADGLSADSREAAAVLLLVNDPQVDVVELDDDARLHKTAATNIIARRNGADGLVGTADDQPFATLADLDDVSFVGPTALARLVEYAIAEGYLDLVPEAGDRSIDVVFSPKPLADSHAARVAELIGEAEHSIDIAMYSFSNADISNALEAAVERGVKVRFLFETASADRKLSGTALQNSKSGRLEAMGVDVRWINKIMHHKLMIVDGPRDVADRADTAQLVSGSANWSFGGATIYDENTLFMSGYPELSLRMQQEFNLLWDHSRDLEANASLVSEASTLEITDAELSAVDEDDAHIHFTSPNFTVTGDTFKKGTGSAITEQLVAAIEGATESIHVASGHLRLRPVAEALIAKSDANPDMDIRVYLDAQEYMSETTHNIQVAELGECLEAATTQSKINSCMDKGFLFGFQVGESGVDVRYKWYAQRWHFSYAVQMHHKYLVIDGDELWTGSFNLSDNAEHNTIENMFVFEGAQFADLIEQYESNFETLWTTGHAEELLDQLVTEIEESDVIPLVFAPMALGQEEVRQLKALIVERCPQVNSLDFRKNPDKHHVCVVG